MRFAYLGSESVFPQDIHLIDGLRELGHEVNEIREIEEIQENADAVIVGFTAPILAIKARFGSRKKVLFNAGITQHDANVVSRESLGFLGLRAFKWWLIDFLSFHASTKILLESDAQIDFVHKLYFVPRKKMVRAFAGVNEKEFFLDSKIKKRNKFTVLFRGRFLPESGILTVIEAAKKLENQDVDVIVVGFGFMYKKVNALLAELSPKNLTMIQDKMPPDDLRNLMLSSHISLGQMANHPRLERTLPCKLFESLALGLPYLTARNKAVFEVLTEDKNCFAVNPGDADDLARKILELKSDRITLDRIARSGHDLYQEKLTSKKLAEDVVSNCF